MKIFIYIACAAGVLLAGCASIPTDRGRSISEALLKTHSSTASMQTDGDPQALTAELLGRPLDAEASVRVALINNPRMRMLYAELGLAQADVYDASRLANPSLGYVELSASGSVTKTTWNLSQRFTELLFLRFKTHVARDALLQAQQRVAHEVLGLEAEVRKAYYRYVGENLVAQMRERVAASATASAQYAQALYQAGNISELQLNRELASASAAKVQQYKARAQAVAARGEMLKLLAVSNDASVQFVERLPLPAQPMPDVPALQRYAAQQRLDLLATQEALRTMQTNVQHTRRWRWLGGIELGAERERDLGRTSTGPRAALELPLFNPGGGAVLRSKAQFESLNAQKSALELAILNDIAVQVENLKTAEQVVQEYRQRLVPLQSRVVELAQQQQNFMLIGAFELLSAKQEELDTYQAYLEAVRDYWTAYTELARVAGGRLPDAPEHSENSVGIDARAATEQSDAPRADLSSETGGGAQAGEHRHE